MQGLLHKQCKISNTWIPLSFPFEVKFSCLEDSKNMNPCFRVVVLGSEFSPRLIDLGAYHGLDPALWSAYTLVNNKFYAYHNAGSTLVFPYGERFTKNIETKVRVFSRIMSLSTTPIIWRYNGSQIAALETSTQRHSMLEIYHTM